MGKTSLSERWKEKKKFPAHWLKKKKIPCPCIPRKKIPCARVSSKKNSCLTSIFHAPHQKSNGSPLILLSAKVSSLG